MFKEVALYNNTYKISFPSVNLILTKYFVKASNDGIFVYESEDVRKAMQLIGRSHVTTSEVIQICKYLHKMPQRYNSDTSLITCHDLLKALDPYF